MFVIGTVNSPPKGITEIAIRAKKTGDHRGEAIENEVDVRRDEPFLRDELDDVRQRLQQAVRTDAIGAHAQLDVRDHFAFDPLQVGEGRHENEHDDGEFNEADDEEIH